MTWPDGRRISWYGYGHPSLIPLAEKENARERAEAAERREAAEEKHREQRDRDDSHE